MTPTGRGRTAIRSRPGHGSTPLALVAAASVLAGAACAGTEPTADTFTTRDSAGVAIAESTAPLWDGDPGARWSLGAEPVLDLTETGTGPDHEFFRVADALTLPDGRILVASWGSNEIRAYSPEGRWLATVGGDGDGPGEYRQIMGVWPTAGDSVLVADFGGPVTVLGPDLEYARSYVLPPLTSNVTHVGDGITVAILLATSVGTYEGESALLRDREPIVAYGPEGALLDTVATPLGFEQYMAVEGERRTSIGTFFGKGMALTAGNGRIWIGENDSLSYDVYRADGSLERIVRVPGHDLSLDPAEVEMRRDSILRRDLRPSIRAAYRAMPVPQTRPAYTELVVDSEGHLWAGAHQDPFNYEEPRDWIVFDPDGRWLGTLTTPARFRVHEIGSDYLLGIFRDSLDVEHVQMLPLTR